jgi:transketolase
VPLEAIRRFRQLDSKCPGHPEYRWTSGIETTTGPLGQGIATSVGMALGGKWMAAHFNRPDFPLFDFDVYALCGDGCLMEGASSEAASLAGHLRLSNLCWIYDNNKITIEGSTDVAFSEDVATRFIGYGWNVTRVGDANDVEMLAAAFQGFKNEAHRPTLIIVDSHIGYGSSKQDSHTAHGEPLGEKVIAEFKQRFGLAPEKFHVPDGVYDHFQEGIGGAARRCGTPGSPRSRSTRPGIRSWPTSSTGCSTGSSRTAGTRTCRPSRPTPRAWPGGSRRRRCSTPSRPTSRG